MPRHVDLQRPRTEHPPAESGFKTKATNGTIGTFFVLNEKCAFGYTEFDKAEKIFCRFLRFFDCLGDYKIFSC